MTSRVAKREKEAREEARRAKRAARDARRRGGLLPRESEVREVHTRALVVCEGARTEPNYFRCFPIRSGDVVDVQGVGMNTMSLVEEARRVRDADDHDEVWVVFDRDDFPAEQVNNALQRAEALGYRVAFSNQAFELWYLLHFEYCDADLSRTTYGARLTQHLARAYRKNDPSMYHTLVSRSDVAVRNATRLRERWGPEWNPARDCPCTTVYELVLRLRELSA